MDSPMGKVPIMDSVKVGFTYFKDNWKMWIPAALTMGIISAAAHAVMITPTPGFSSILAWIVNTLGFMALGVAIYKHIFRAEYQPPLGVTIGADEMRVFGISAGLALIFGIIFGFIGIIFMGGLMSVIARAGIDPALAQSDPDAFLAAVNEAVGSGGGAMFFAIGALILGVLAIFVSIRLCLVVAATVAEGRMMAFQTWSFTKGNFWQVLAAYLLVIFPVAIVGGIIVSIVQAILIGPGGDEALIVASRAQIMAVGFVNGFVNAMGSVPFVALLAHLYEGLRPSDDEMQALAEKSK